MLVDVKRRTNQNSTQNPFAFLFNILFTNHEIDDPKEP